MQPVEIAGQNGSKLREFYGFLFDWKIDKSDPAGLSNVRTGGRSGIDGAIREEENGPVEITRMDRGRMVEVTGANSTGVTLGQADAELHRLVAEMNLPAGYSVRSEGMGSG